MIDIAATRLKFAAYLSFRGVASLQPRLPKYRHYVAINTKQIIGL